jgi:hypothetical protein
VARNEIEVTVAPIVDPAFCGNQESGVRRSVLS